MRPSPALLLLVLACASRETPHITIDTLPTGTVRVANGTAAEWPAGKGWRLGAGARIGTDTAGAAALLDPQQLAVDAAERVYVVDQVVKLYDATGRYVRTIGGRGEGPGEYRSPALSTAGMDLVITDATLARVTVYDSAGRYRTSWRTWCCAMASAGVDSSGTIAVWAPSQETSWRWIRFGLDGTLRDTLTLPALAPPRRWELGTSVGPWGTTVPFTPRVHAAPHPWGGVLYGWSGAYALTWLRAPGDSALRVSRDPPATPLAAARREAAVAQITGFITKHGGKGMGTVDPAEVARTIRLDDVPAEAPAFVSLAVGPDGTAWVERDGGSDTTRSRYDLFTAGGIYLGEIVAPTRFDPFGRTAWSRDAVYAIVEEEDGATAVMRYPIER